MCGLVVLHNAILGSLSIRIIAAGAVAVGKLIKKHHRQDRDKVNAPLIIGTVAMAVYLLAPIKLR